MKTFEKIREAFTYDGYMRSAYVKGGLCLFAAFVITFQHLCYRMPNYPLDRSRYKVTKATGLKKPWIYSYALFYWGLFPVYSTYKPKQYDENSARDMLIKHGETLRMEYGHEIRFGEYFKYYLPYFYSLVVGKPGNHNWSLINSFFFLVSLYLLLFNFYRFNRTILGIFTALFISSSEFQAVQMTSLQSFSYIITGATFTIAFMCPFIFNQSLRFGSILVRLLLTSFFIVFTGNIRSSAMPIFFSPFCILPFYGPYRFFKRLLLILLYLAIFGFVYFGVQKYFDYKISQAAEFVEAAGGIPYLGERTKLHPFWHMVWCGLGDFDTKYGYEWRDAKAYHVAATELNKRGWKPPKMDPTQGEYLRIETSPIYEEVIRDIVLANIKKDPSWYLQILWKRVKKILTEWEDPELNMVFYKFKLWHSFWPYLLFLVLLILLRMWGEIKLILITIPTITVAIAVTTITNSQYYLIAHLVCAAVMVTCLINSATYVLAWIKSIASKRNMTGHLDKEAS